MISINNNLSATGVANTLNSHYGRLQTSTERLSSGLRINGAADDAAGLAIRELMRSDIAALRQGMRNVNDAISMIQTFDGALSVIDEKLIRMKELAEQAATGTYDSTQRLMIDSEFQAMGAEINRIARATDFNGIKLLDGKFETAGVEAVGPDGKTYSKNITSSEVIANNINGIRAKNWSDADINDAITDPGQIVGDKAITLTNKNIAKIGDKFLAVTIGYNSLTPGQSLTISYDPASATGNGRSGGWFINNVEATMGDSQGFLWINGTDQLSADIVDSEGNAASLTTASTGTWTVQSNPSFDITGGTLVDTKIDGNNLTFTIDVGGGNVIEQTYSGVTTGNNNPSIAGFISATINISVRDTTPDPDAPEDDEKIPDDVVRIHFGPENDSAEDYYDIKKHDATLKGLGLEGVAIKTQDTAQNALVQINDAIVTKDKIRAEYGAMQNRLENTMTSLSIQAENLQSSESRISDAEIAQEMMQFVRNQILTQSAIAMLAQANSMPQMVMSLIH